MDEEAMRQREEPTPFYQRRERKHSSKQHSSFCSPSLTTLSGNTPVPCGEQRGWAGLEQGEITAEIERALSCSWRHVMKLVRAHCAPSLRRLGWQERRSHLLDPPCSSLPHVTYSSLPFPADLKRFFLQRSQRKKEIDIIKADEISLLFLPSLPGAAVSEESLETRHAWPHH